MTRVRHVAVAVCCALATPGCAATAARQSLIRPDPPASYGASTTALPVDRGHSSSPATQQSGQGNLAAQLDARGWTGLEYTTAVPVGQVILMGLMLLLSHRREALRIRQNGLRH
ncbi:MAG: hypothetical protein GY842_27535 [bacterium]|nr:hypothetical protein [bacterium]